MARKPKYTAQIITREVVYIDNSTCYPATPTFEERMIDGINGGNLYTFCELYSKVGTIEGDTLAALDANAWSWAETNGNYDFHLHVIK